MPRGEYERSGGLSPREKTQEALTTLEDGIDAILTGDAFADYLRTLARFHSYSFGNVLLIGMQRPDATQVAGFRRWQELGRQVRKGEKGIKILVPHVYRTKGGGEDRVEEDREPGVAVVRGFGVGTVFDVSQTDGPSLPEPPPVELLDGASDVGMRLFVDLTDYLDGEGIPVERADTGGANGSYDPQARRIFIGQSIDGDQATKTLTHEAAHAVAGHTLGMNSADVETVAESAAFVILNHYGIDSSGYSFGYVSGWTRNKVVFKRNLAAIQETSHAILGALEGDRLRSSRLDTSVSAAPRVVFEA